MMNYYETKSTLEFATRAKAIRNKIKLNVFFDNEHCLIKQLKGELKMMRSKLKEMNNEAELGKKADELANENSQLLKDKMDMERQLEELSKQIHNSSVYRSPWSPKSRLVSHRSSFVNDPLGVEPLKKRRHTLAVGEAFIEALPAMKKSPMIGEDDDIYERRRNFIFCDASTLTDRDEMEEKLDTSMEEEIYLKKRLRETQDLLLEQQKLGTSYEETEVGLRKEVEEKDILIKSINIEKNNIISELEKIEKNNSIYIQEIYSENEKKMIFLKNENEENSKKIRDDLIQDFTQKMTSLEMENSSLKQQLTDTQANDHLEKLTSENSSLKEKIIELESENSSLIEKITKLEMDNSSFIEKITKLEMDNSTFVENNKEKSLKIEEKLEEVRAMNEKLESEINEYKSNEEKKDTIFENFKIENYKNLSDIENDYKEKLQNSDEKIKDLNSTIEDLKNDILNINSDHDERTGEINENANKEKDTLLNVISDLEKKIKNLEIEKNEKNEKNKEFENEKNEYLEKINKYENIYIEINNNYNLEIEKNKNIIFEKDEIIENINKKFKGLERQVQGLQAENDDLITENNSINSILKAKDGEGTEAEKEAAEERNRLKLSLSNLSNELQKINIEKNDVIDENMKLNIYILELKNEKLALERLIDDTTEKESKYKQIQDERDDLKAKEKKMQFEVDDLQQKISINEEKFQNIFEEGKLALSTQRNKIENYEKEIKDLKEEKEDQISTNVHLESKLRENEIQNLKIIEVEEEKNKYKSQYEDIDRRLQDIMKSSREDSSKNGETVTTLQIENTEKEHEIRILKEELKTVTSKNQSYVDELKEKIETMNDEKNNIHESLVNIESEKLAVEKKVIDIESEKLVVEKKVDSLNELINKGQERLNQLNNENQQLKEMNNDAKLEEIQKEYQENLENEKKKFETEFLNNKAETVETVGIQTDDISPSKNSREKEVQVGTTTEATSALLVLQTKNRELASLREEVANFRKQLQSERETNDALRLDIVKIKTDEVDVTVSSASLQNPPGENQWTKDLLQEQASSLAEMRCERDELLLKVHNFESHRPSNDSHSVLEDNYRLTESVNHLEKVNSSLKARCEMLEAIRLTTNSNKSDDNINTGGGVSNQSAYRTNSRFSNYDTTNSTSITSSVTSNIYTGKENIPYLNKDKIYVSDKKNNNQKTTPGGVPGGVEEVDQCKQQ
eukprot:GHVL01001241.1.p1 GENE.GHVL01001241.1~~GHVL01001241.1.p1  ORF type:complete len:1201 (+),score=463.98 GHVL01001241.1:1045-4647(+)